MHRLQFIAAAVVVVASQCASADYAFVNIAPLTTSDLKTYTGGSAYPVGGQTLNFGGVPFALALKSGQANTLGAVQLPTNGQVTTYSFPVNVTGATHLYTLINSAWGSFGANNGSVEVVGTNGAFVSLSLVQGSNIRDHYQGSYQNIINDPTVVPTVYATGARLDRQVITLPPSFVGQTVTEVRFKGMGNNPNGAAFIAGATFETAPACFGDLNGDGSVGASDLAILLGAWGTAGADLDGDGATGPSDLALILGAWGACP